MDSTAPEPDAQDPSNAEPSPFSFRDRIIIQSHLESLAQAAKERAVEAEVERLAKERGLLPADPKAKPPRRPKPSSSLKAKISAAKQAGATSVTLPDGMRVTFNGADAAADEANEWDQALEARRHGAN